MVCVTGRGIKDCSVGKGLAITGTGTESAKTLLGCPPWNQESQEPEGAEEQTAEHVLRVAYYFDPIRKAFLLTGGDKKGQNQEKFYKNLIAEAESIIEKHEKDLEEEK